MKIKKKYLPDLARICADITGDGHLQIQNWRYLTSFYSNDKKQINKIQKKFLQVFGVRGRLYTIKRINLQYRFFIISKEVALHLQSIGVPKGKKTDQIFKVPNWIYNGNKKIKSSYLRGLFACEGCVYATKQKNGKKRWRISIEMYKAENLLENGKEFMQQLKNILQQFNIVTSPVRFGSKTIRKNGTISRGIKFELESKQFKKFYKHIGFDESNKTKVLQEAIAGI